jgi:putative ABC transport system substrate-binding protein
VKTRRRLLTALGAGALLAPFASLAQQPARIFRIGLIAVGSASSSASRVEGLRSGLREFGYVEGKNVVIDYRWAEGKYDRLTDLAAELVRLNVDVIVAQGSPGSRAAMQVTATVPIVMSAAGDALTAGLVTSLARPGKNVTGLSVFSPEIGAKRMELIKEVLPRARQVAALSNPGNPTNASQVQAVETAARSLKVGLRLFAVRGPDEFNGTFAAMGKLRLDALANLEDAMLNVNPERISEFAIKRRLPAVGNKEFAEAGGLLGYGVNYFEIFRRAAFFVDKILKGANPGDIPVEQPTKFELVVNMKTAKALAIAIPQSILVRADKVIE